MFPESLNNGIEIERRFLVRDAAPPGERAKPIVQAYLDARPEATDRIRYDGKSWIRTRKRRIDALSSEEREQYLAEAEGKALLQQATGRVIRKHRSLVPARENGLFWEIDRYQSPMKGLAVAEIELPARDFSFELPPWIGPEITADKRFGNAALSQISEEQEQSLWQEIRRLWDAESIFRPGAVR